MGLLLVLAMALFFRLYGLNWDQNQHLHPDERFLTMVTQQLSWPDSFREYLNPETSSLNPYNNGFNFYVYGTLPLKVVKFAGGFLQFEEFDYNNITLAGRFISAILDALVVLLVFMIAKKIIGEKAGLLAAFFYAIFVLSIQLSHFYAVDTYLVFFITLCFYHLIKLIEARNIYLQSAILAVSFGLALASKISALLFTPIIILGYVYFLLKRLMEGKSILTVARSLLSGFIVFILLTYLTLRLSDPRIFAAADLLNVSLNPQFIANLKQLKSFDNPENLFPPAIQWIKTKPIVFPGKNMVLWGLGLPLGVTALSGVFFSFYLLLKNINLLSKSKTFKQLGFFPKNVTIKQFSHFLVLFWILLLFFYQGTQFSKAMRYFYPIYPFLAILAANITYKAYLLAKKKLRPKMTILLSGHIAFLLMIWPLSFIQIYSRPHSRVAASAWIYQNIPPGSTISCEHWDDCLPLSMGTYNSQGFYTTEMLELFNRDTPQKWERIDEQLAGVDYLILSSNRLWGSIPKVPEIYPQTARFYQKLFSGELDFILVAEFRSYPTVPILNIQIPDGSADESFTVYDHPKILIFKKI